MTGMSMLVEQWKNLYVYNPRSYFAGHKLLTLYTVNLAIRNSGARLSEDLENEIGLKNNGGVGEDCRKGRMEMKSPRVSSIYT